MRRLRFLAAVLAGLTLFGVANAADDQSAAITNAALAPYRDELLAEAPALCSDLTPSAEATIVPGTPQGESCQEAVQGAFAQASPPAALPRSSVLSLRASASHLKIEGRRATGIFSLTTSETVERHGTPATAIVFLGRYQLALEEVAGRWLVSSMARLVVVDDCTLRPHGHCRSGTKDLVFMLGVPQGETPAESIPDPPAVRRGSRREQREFAAGRSVFAQSGCLACHRIGDVGNPGPGQNLTHVGARLSPSQIERALVSSRAPMPSFRNLPAGKRKDLVRFLSLLR